jgi:L-ribulose-5-phosphate 3-epimerase
MKPAESTREFMQPIYGVMQGRLSPPEEGRFQAFPRRTWRDEIRLAKEAGFSYIEWIHDDYDRGANPIFSESGLLELKALKAQYGIATPALCGDWFMDFPLVRCSEQEREQREQHLCELLPVAQKLGACKIVLPFVDNSKMTTDEEKQSVAGVLKRVLPLAQRHGIELHLETDLDPAAFRDFLQLVPHPSLKVNWDSGNSSGLGYIASEEFAAYGNRIGSVHIKDRYRKPEGGVETRPLGSGFADFDDVFRAIRSIDYAGGLTLQVARGAPGDEVNFLRGQIEFLERYR